MVRHDNHIHQPNYIRAIQVWRIQSAALLALTSTIRGWNDPSVGHLQTSDDRLESGTSREAPQWGAVSGFHRSSAVNRSDSSCAPIKSSISTGWRLGGLVDERRNDGQEVARFLVGICSFRFRSRSTPPLIRVMWAHSSADWAQFRPHFALNHQSVSHWQSESGNIGNDPLNRWWIINAAFLSLSLSLSLSFFHSVCPFYFSFSFFFFFFFFFLLWW